MKKLFTYYIYVFAAGVMLFAAGCAGKSAKDDPISKKEKDSVEVRPEVVFAVADDKPLYQYVQSQGVVEANRQITLKPKISGFAVISNIEDGRWVQKGDTLLAFEKDEWEYALEQARDDYEKAQSAYRIENRLRKTRTDTNQSPVKSDRMVRITTGLAKADLALKRARLDLSYATLTAPFSGRLATDHRIARGAYIAAGSELGQLVNDATVRVRFDVLEVEMSKVKKGLSAVVTAPGGQALKGNVSAVSPVFDTQSKTGNVIVSLNNRQQFLRPGMTVDGRILVQEETGKARIPRAAILSRDGGRTLVFKLHPNTDEVEWIYVTPQAENSEWAIVDNPNIAPGDTLAVGNHFALSHLQKVTPKMQGQITQEGSNTESGN